MNKARNYFIDHLRIVLTVLVVFHHAANTYGAVGGWYWRAVEAPSLPLILFGTVNQAFFMGFFFLLAGYFTPPAFDRKGGAQFFADRAVRLGIPLLFYGFVIGPMTVALAQTQTEGTAFLDNLWSLWSQAYFGIGPLWFAEALLIFAAGYWLWRSLEFKTSPVKFPSQIALLLAALGVGAAAFCIRLVVPLGQDLLGLQIGYFASYIFLFVVGCLAWQGQWLEQVNPAQAKRWLIVMLFALPVVPLAILLNGGIDGARGGRNLMALIYAFWEPLVAWGIILGLLWQFRLRADQPSLLGKWLAERAYTVFIIHPPVLVGISLLLHPWSAPPLIKFVVAGSAACVGCVAIASALLSIPGARRVL